MRTLASAAILTVAFAAAAAQAPGNSQADSAWTLTQGTLTYHMSHPVHEVDGTSRQPRGKGVCHAGTCDFLVAAPVKSFDSGDTNRDLHMLQTVRGGQFPVVTVRFRLPASQLDAPTLDADLDVQFAGQTAHYAHVPFHQSIEGGAHHITGTVPATLTDFKIDPPTFLTVPIKNEIPVRVDTVWKPS